MHSAYFHQGAGMVDMQPESERTGKAEASRRVQGSNWRGKSTARLREKWCVVGSDDVTCNEQTLKPASWLCYVIFG
jgi:hypothetical protein